MALPTQTIDILFSKGLDTKHQKALLPSGSLLKAENATRLKTGEFRKRKGFKAFGDTTFTNPQAITTYKDELVAIAGNNLNSYDSNTDTWINKDTLVIGTTDFQRVHSNPTANQDRGGVAVIGNLSLYTWVDANVLRYSIQDNTTNTDLVVNQAAGTVACAADNSYCVVALGNKFYIIGNGSSNDMDAFVVESTAGFATSQVTLRDDYNTTLSVIDCGVVSNQLYISYRETGGNVRTVTLNSSGVVTNIQDIAETAAAIGSYAYTATDQGEDRYGLAWVTTGDVIRSTIYNDNLLVREPPTTIESTQTNVNKIIIHENPSDDNEILIYWDRYDSSIPGNSFIRTGAMDTAGVTTGSAFLRSVALYSKALVNASKGYFTVKHESELQSTMFVVQSVTGEVIAKFAQSTSAVIENSGFATPFISLCDSKFVMALDVRGRLISEDNTLFTFSDTASGVIDFELNDAYNSVEAGNLLYLAGGALHHYDGQFITEAGFHLFPEGLLNTLVTNGSGSISDGTRQYVAVYTWYDNQGNRHQSAPSEAVTLVFSNGTSTQTGFVDVPTLRLSRKNATRGKVIIDLYRTEAAGSIFYKTTSLTTITENDFTVDKVTFADSTTDANLISNEILYTEGGVLDNIAAPACKRLAVFDNRLFLAGLPESNELRYSKIIRPGSGVSFNEVLTEFIPQKSEEVTAIFPLDSNLVVFKDDQVFVMSGVGPTDTGVDSGFISPEVLAADTGAIDARSLVLGPNGIYFKSRKGIYLLTRGLELVYIGAAVEDFNDKTITSAVLITDTNEIRFTTSDDTIIAYNYLFQDWTTFTGFDTKDSAIWQDTHLILYSDGTVGQQVETFRDRDAFYSLKLQTGWLKLQNLAGYQRVRRAVFYGTYQTAHKLRIKVYTDYSDTVRQTVVFDPTTVLSQQTFYGDDTPYGNESPYGGTIDNDLYMFEVHIEPQKCNAIRFEIDDLINADVDPSNSGEALRLVGFSMQLGVKQGLGKLRNGRKA